MKKFKVVALVYAVLAIIVILSAGCLLPEAEAKKYMTIVALPAIIGYCIYGIAILVSDIQELRFCIEYHKVGRDFKRLCKAAAIETFDFSTYHIFGKVKVLVLWLFPAVITSMAALYVAIGFNLLNPYGIIASIALFVLVLPFSYLDIVISYGLERIRTDLRICGETIGY